MLLVTLRIRCIVVERHALGSPGCGSAQKGFIVIAVIAYMLITATTMSETPEQVNCTLTHTRLNDNET